MNSIELSGKSLYITGTISNHTKKELRKIVERKGMVWMKTINGDLDFLITGDDPGVKKVELANEIGSIIDPRYIAPKNLALNGAIFCWH